MADTQRRYYNGKEYDMILRDLLAADRTNLANERTFLAYCRTALGAFGGGVGMLKFINDIPWVVTMAYILIAVSPLVLFFGVVRFVQIRRKLNGPPIREEENSEKF